MTATPTLHWAFPIFNTLDFVAMGCDINASFDDSIRYIACGSARTLSSSVQNYSHKVVLLDTAGGCTVTLPPATGSGTQIRFIVTVLPSGEGSRHVIKVANAADTMCGIIRMMDDTDNNLVAFAAAADSDTITLNPTITEGGTTSGGVTIGEHLELEDIAPNTWLVSGVLTNTDDPETPFSAAVS